ncbi:hypothetical protein [Spiroplasma endosymbiont of Nomada rufipes]
MKFLYENFLQFYLLVLTSIIQHFIKHYYLYYNYNVSILNRYH